MSILQNTKQHINSQEVLEPVNRSISDSADSHQVSFIEKPANLNEKREGVKGQKGSEEPFSVRKLELILLVPL